jgi:hypothetical protein
MAVSNIWTLQRASDGLEQSLAAWGISAATFTRRTQKSDTLVVKLEGAAFDAAEAFSYKSIVYLKRGGTIYFVGCATKTPRMGRPSAESVGYTFEGPWWWLEHVPYNQAWMFLNGGVDYVRGGGYYGLVPELGATPGTQSITNLILGIDDTGAALTTGQQIEDALICAQNAGAPFQLGGDGSIDPSILIPAEGARDLTCAEVVRRMMRWHPDCVIYFDYTTTLSGAPKPTIHIKARANLPAVSFAVAGTPATAMDILARPDLQVPVVLINYEILNRLNDQDQRILQQDQFPADVSPEQPGAIVMTIDLQGEKTTYARQYLKTAPLLYNDLGWWKERLPWLTDTNIANLYASANPAGANPESTNGGSVAPINPDGGADSTAATDGTDLANGSTTSGTVWGNFLIEGDIPNWINGHAQMALAQLRVNYDVAMGNDANGNPVVEHHVNETIFVKVLSTDLATGWYNQLTGVYLGEPVPTGLAENYWLALSWLQYEGSWEITEPDCGTANLRYLGLALNLTGGVGAWATMKAMIYQSEEDLATGVTRLRFGPVEYLSPKDWLTVQRTARDRLLGDRQARVNGLLTIGSKPAGGSGKHDRGGSGSKAPPSFDNWSGAPTGGNPGLYKVAVQPATLDSSAVAALLANQTMQVRAIQVCVGGVLKTQLFLCSAPF